MEVVSRNAAVLIYSKKNVPGFMSIFTSPELQEKHIITLKDQSYNLYIILYPIVADDIHSKRKNRVLLKLKNDLKIELAIIRDENSADQLLRLSNLTKAFKDSYQPRDEVSAIKAYAAIDKYGSTINKSIFTGSFGFISKMVNCDTIDTLSDEASNVIIYEADGMDIRLKNKIYNEFMNKKGISLVFSKDLSKIIKNSDTLILDNSIDLSSYSSLLEKKLIYGRNKAEGGFIHIFDTILSDKPVEDFTNKSIHYFLKDEILSILRCFNRKLTVKEFVSLFSYTYIYSNEDSWSLLY